MKLDSVSVVVRFDLVGSGESYFGVEDSYWKATFLGEPHVYYGHGAAYDAQEAQEAADELNGMYKTPERYYGAVRLDIEDAIKERLV